MHSVDRKIAIALAVAAIFGATTASAGVIFVEDLSNPVNVVGITGFSTNGNDMAGMIVTATFSTGSPESIAWQGLGGDAGEASGTGWSLDQSGDTFDQPWTLVTERGQSDILSVEIDGLAGEIVFDRTFGNVFGTDNSALGQDFFLTNLILDPTDVITVTYSNPIGVGGALPVGDLFGTLLIQFDFTGRGFHPGINDGILPFLQDTDTVGLPPGQAPEPGALLLLGAGLAALYRRRRS